MIFRRAMLATVVIVLVLMPATLAFAQQETPPAQTPTDLYIAWPQPVTEVHGVINIQGTADIPNQAFYRLEAITVNPDYTIPERPLPISEGVFVVKELLEKHRVTVAENKKQADMFGVATDVERISKINAGS